MTQPSHSVLPWHTPLDDSSVKHLFAMIFTDALAEKLAGQFHGQAEAAGGPVTGAEAAGPDPGKAFGGRKSAVGYRSR